MPCEPTDEDMAYYQENCEEDMPEDAVLCPGMDEGQYCDCSGDCHEHPEFCGCDEALACCQGSSELPKCECEGWQSGSATGDEMCAFQGGVNCALKYLNSEWDEGCPDNAFHCVLEIPEEPECPEVMCFMHCESGYVQDENGCDTCECVEECVDNADFANARGQTCEVIGKKFAQKGKECTTDALFENCCATCASLKEEPEPEPICEDGEEDNSNPCQPATCFDGMWMSYHIDCAEGWVDCQVDWVPPAEGECCSTCPCWDAVCTAEVCLEGTPAPIPEGECCGDVTLCPKIETCPDYDYMPSLGSDCSMLHFVLRLKLAQITITCPHLAAIARCIRTDFPANTGLNAAVTNATLTSFIPAWTTCGVDITPMLA